MKESYNSKRTTLYSRDSIWAKYKIHQTLPIDFYWLDEINHIISNVLPINQEEYVTVCVLLIGNTSYSPCGNEAASDFTYMES